ncbi:hypothetical protein BV25DRAFT_1817672 [Artomyces pyxidatus]|uniref:Uncharacterized protein n=1 Tax=Artomyces pyxidatus TaxID=48021 RepID=A0ACB8TK04_9AGAM|nr:hypothetical protein BV25DRAFT_1817672 [Artomyces pyxidatus]
MHGLVTQVRAGRTDQDSRAQVQRREPPRDLILLAKGHAVERAGVHRGPASPSPSDDPQNAIASRHQLLTAITATPRPPREDLHAPGPSSTCGVGRPGTRAHTARPRH